jgi:hypothetical protein
MDFLSSVFAWLSDREAGISAVVGIAVLAGIVLAGLRSLVRRRAETSAEKICEFVCQKRGQEKSIEHVLESVPSIGHRFREDLCPGAAETVRRI